MKKYNHLIGSLLLASSALFVVSCDDEETKTPSAVSFHSDAFAASESDGAITLGVQLDNPALEDTQISLSIAGGTAAEGSDYSMPETTVTIPAGETNGSFTINFAKDIVDEEDETIEVTASSSGLTSEGKYTITIQDDDCPFNFVTDLGGVDGFINGLGYNAPADVTVAQDGSNYTISGLNVAFMENVWGEEVIASEPVTFSMDAEGNITIEEQYIFTTLYNGSEYDYSIYGTGVLNTCDGTIELHYEMSQDGFLVGEWLHANGYMADEIFRAVLEVEE